MMTKTPPVESSSAEAPMEIEKTLSLPVETRWFCIDKKFDSISLQHIDDLKDSVSRLSIHFCKPDYHRKQHKFGSKKTHLWSDSDAGYIYQLGAHQFSLRCLISWIPAG